MKIGPLYHGRKMSLKVFEFAETEPDYHYELSRGYVTVSEIANFIHALIVSMIRDSFGAYRIAHPEFDHLILNGMECKLLIPDLESERHPDIAVYLTRPKGPKNRTFWRRWIPALVIEVVSPESDHRDYCDKRDEYWTLGVKEYWIVDAKRGKSSCCGAANRTGSRNVLGPATSAQPNCFPDIRWPANRSLTPRPQPARTKSKQSAEGAA